MIISEVPLNRVCKKRVFGNIHLPVRTIEIYTVVENQFGKIINPTKYTWVVISYDSVKGIVWV